MHAVGEKIYLFLGNNIDKKYMDTVKKCISCDYHIWSLYHIATIKYLVLTVLCCISMSDLVYGFFHQLFQGKSVLYFASIKGIILAGTTLYLLFSSISSATGAVVSARKYLSYVLVPRHFKNPLQIWNPQVGTVSDSQITAALGRKYRNNVQVFYSGEPYYEIRAIDSLIISFGDNWISFLKRSLKYFIFFMDYSSKYLAACLESEIFEEKDRALNVSNAVFGILFVSAFFSKSFLDLKKSEQKFKICVSKDFIPKDKGKIALTKTFVEYCLSSDIFQWTDEADENKVFMLCGATFLGDTSNNNKVKILLKHFFNKQMVIPVKRFVAVPKDSEDGLLPYAADFQNMKYGIILGGAEQNLTLQYIINFANWHGDGRKVRLGIAENAFDDYMKKDFCIGTESLVYGVTNILNERADKKSGSMAEILGIEIKKRMFYSIYGYSAIITKMSVFNFIKHYEEHNPDRENTDAIPGKAKFTSYHIRYKVDIGNEHSLYSSSSAKEWDQNVINDEERLIEWLNKNPLKIVQAKTDYF
ncbi:hypothetical protein [Aminipila terrae]|uniref:Uncharacterized protein n=1 Tax=Aminipila terrae TaxID=2697030 RepID=A0A6P1MBH1_9FIRM|nr:hypothetical protein [Aminipila terrae]QHI72049.1 hypothetical protein Ami3637_06245 [Aminipila terrae]